MLYLLLLSSENARFFHISGREPDRKKTRTILFVEGSLVGGKFKHYFDWKLF